MKHIDVIFIMVQSPLLISWVVLAKDGISYGLASLLSIVTILYMYEKYRLMRVDRKTKEKELTNNNN